MRGVTLEDGNGQIAVFGSAAMPWGKELWMAMRDGAPMAVRLRIARLLRFLVGTALEDSDLYVHAPGDYPYQRLLRWLSFEPVALVAGAVRWKAERCLQR
jgi:hypothetical protein